MRSKYRNKITELDGIKFHSAKEAKRYSELKLLEKAGEISNLKLQVVYQLIPPMRINDKHYRAICYYADFVYNEKGITVCEDVKGMQTDIFKIKLRLMKQVHGIDIKIT